MAAYELVEIYCELMAARLPMIESQKYFQTLILCFLSSFLEYCMLPTLLAIKFMSLNMSSLHCFLVVFLLRQCINIGMEEGKS